MSILLVADHDNSELKDTTLKAMAAAQALGGDVDVLVAGEGASAVAEAAGNINGVRKVLHAESSALGHGIAEAFEALITPMMDGYEAVMFVANTTGKNAAPRIAAKLDVTPISDIIAVEGQKTFKRPIYAGNAIETIETSDSKLVITVRPTAFEAVATDGSASVETIDAPGGDYKTEFVSEAIEDSDRPELTAAKVVVSGGRALGSEENFQIIENLADKLGAAVGASRAAVDAGYAPNDYQVGQTGKVVAPELYIAIGISGAIQHLAGMKDSKIIVAINKDGEAPIFQVADYGLVADLFKAVPELEAAL